VKNCWYPSLCMHVVWTIIPGLDGPVYVCTVRVVGAQVYEKSAQFRQRSACTVSRLLTSVHAAPCAEYAICCTSEAFLDLSKIDTS